MQLSTSLNLLKPPPRIWVPCWTWCVLISTFLRVSGLDRAMNICWFGLSSAAFLHQSEADGRTSCSQISCQSWMISLISFKMQYLSKKRSIIRTPRREILLQRDLVTHLLDHPRKCLGARLTRSSRLPHPIHQLPRITRWFARCAVKIIGSLSVSSSTD